MGEKKVMAAASGGKDKEAAKFGEEEEHVSAGNDGEKQDVAEILHESILIKVAVRLPTVNAYQWSAVAKTWRDYTNKPVFLKQHLEPRPLKLDDTPAALLVQPRTHTRLGYVHALVVRLDAKDPMVNVMAVHPTFTHLAAEPAPTPHVKVAPQPPVPDFISFFKNMAVTGLDFSVVGSHGRLLLGRSPMCYFVCFPERKRFIKLPPPPTLPNLDTAAALHYELLDAGSGIDFRVLLLRVHGRHLMVDKFTSGSGAWVTRDLGLRDDESCFLRPSSTGISSGQRHYWLDLDGQRRGRVLCYNEASGLVSVLSEPPTKQQGWKRLGRALGSVNAGSKVRFSALDAFDPNAQDVRPHAMNGLYMTWTLNDANEWDLELKQVRDVSASFFSVPYDAEMPLDHAGASTSSSIAVKNGVLIHRDLLKGQSREIINLTVGMGGRIGELYGDCDVFPLFL